MTKKNFAVFVLVAGLIFGVVHAFASELNVDLSWYSQRQSTPQISTASQLPEETVIGLFAFALTAFSIKGSRKKV